MDRKRFRALATLSAWLMPMAAIPSPVAAQPHPRADIVIYGCTSGGVVAAIEARRLGRSVLLVCREDYLGGMSTNGLGWSDTGNHRAIGGLSLEFYRKVKRYYDDPSVWVHAPRPARAENFVDGDAMWQFEPKVAERIFEDWAKQAGVTIVRNQPLDRSKRGVEMDGNRITAFRASALPSGVRATRPMARRSTASSSRTPPTTSSRSPSIRIACRAIPRAGWCHGSAPNARRATARPTARSRPIPIACA